ncbi:hypothetical protein BP5796_08206 [Coleophoma crateriformis]|uniref:Clr5 domain-containing protein n=1 Tax=Coleophoma crateriformis TaxID=565419 RepID=A0A3D8RDS2_9HELO|nr:hypothetical protein BP5796_08206 [Coleophoma crateriformis]
MSDYTRVSTGSNAEIDDDFRCQRAESLVSLLKSEEFSITPEEVMRCKDVLIQDLFYNYRALNGSLQKFEPLISRRWQKKSKKQRCAVLDEVWPHMTAMHRPEIRAFFKPPTDRTESEYFHLAPRDKMYFRLPFLNKENLAYGNCLMLLLNSRGRHPPQVFADNDIQAAQLSFANLDDILPVLNGFKMILSAQLPQDYGLLIKITDQPEVRKLQQLVPLFEPVHGLMILDNQNAILSFLICMIQNIIHDLTLEQWFLAPILPEPVYEKAGTHRPITVLNRESLYRVPVSINLDGVISTVRAKKSVAEDHLWALREDPSYWKDTIADISEHCVENVLDDKGHKSPHLEMDAFMDAVIAIHCLQTAHQMYMLWDFIHQTLVEIKSLEADQALCTRKKELLLYCENLLGFASTELRKQFNTLFIGSPMMRSLHIRKGAINKKNGEEYTRVVAKDATALQKDELYQLFSELGAGRLIKLCSLSDLIDAIEVHLETTNQKHRVSGLLEKIISDLGIVGHVKRELLLYQPWASSRFEAQQSCQAELGKMMYPALVKVATLERVFSAEDLKLGRLGKPSIARFHYPHDNKSRESIQSRRRSENNLDALWNVIDRQFEEISQQSLIEALGLTSRTLQRTAPWVEPPKQQQLQDVAEPASIDSFSSMSFQSESSSVAKVQTATKTKQKTRGKRQTGPTEVFNNATECTECTDNITKPAEQACQEIKTIKVSPHTYKVLSTLLFMPGKTDRGREISWQAFLLAMAQLGFSSQHLYGSVWQFEPSPTSGYTRNIQFHQPHPGNKIRFEHAKRIGRRLERAFGWRGHMFELGD